MPGWKPPPPAGMTPAAPQWTAPPSPTCLRCGYAGPPVTASHGGPSGCLAVVLLCVGILPGVLYLLFAGSTETRSCPQCGTFLGQSSGTGCLTALATVAVGCVALGLLFTFLAR